MDALTEQILSARPKSKRQALGEVVMTLIQLLVTFGIEDDPRTISINYLGSQQRLDIATVGPDGHLEQWLMGLNANPHSPDFAASVSLPVTGSVQ
jgi:hypothetical protein